MAKSHCVTPVFSNHDDISSKEDRDEQASYSLGEEKDNVQNHMSISENNNSEYIQESQNREMHLYRTRQLQNKGHCITSALPMYDEISSKDDREEEVCYSEGEPFEDYLYPNNTWDSDDSAHEEDYEVKSGWI